MNMGGRPRTSVAFRRPQEGTKVEDLKVGQLIPSMFVRATATRPKVSGLSETMLTPWS
jgi:hypothetical protein